MSAVDDHEAVHAQLGEYFDGALAADDERAVLEHLADCERCQTALDDLMGMHVALGRAPDATSVTATTTSATQAPPVVPARSSVENSDPGAKVIPLAPRRARRVWAMAGLALAAAAAVILVVWAPWRSPHVEPQLALADTRPVEVRFSAPTFATHRPYRVDRGGPSATPMPLATLSALERRGDRAGLIAALAWSGDRQRAGAVLEAMPVSADVLVDRAALALLRGQPEAALEAADQALLADDNLTAARWNRALALRDLHLPLAAAVELERVAVRGEPGWAAEASERAKALRDELGRRRAALAEATARRRAALTGGPPLTEADVASTPTEARTYFHEALRVATSAADVDRLAGLAAALDRASGGEHTTRELARVRATDLAQRARFADRYREVTSGKATPEAIATLITDLAKAGPELDDVRLGVILAGGQLAARLDDVDALVAHSTYPMFQLLAVQERLAQGLPRNGDRLLAEAVCDNPAWALRCGSIDRWQSPALLALGLGGDGERAARRAVARLGEAGVSALEDDALTMMAEALTYRGRLVFAAAVATEVRERTAVDGCASRRFAGNRLAELERRRGAFARARELLSDPDACPEGLDPSAVGAAVDLARDSGDAGDRAIADRWIAAGRAAGFAPLLCDVAAARLHIADRADARGVLLRAVAVPVTDGLGAAINDWAARTLIVDDGGRGDWKAAFDHTLQALGQKGPTTCAIALAADDTILTASWRDASGAVGGAQWREPTPWPALPATALQGCATTSIVALSPLHGRPPPWALGAWSWSSGRATTAPTSIGADRLVIAATTPPQELIELPNLAPVPVPAGSRGLTGTDATPSRVAAAMTNATYVEIHAHGLVDLDTDDGGFIALSPDGDGGWRLTATDVRALKLKAAPVVVLAACRAAEATPHALKRWSLPDAFLAAGARAVIAADVEVPDDLIRAFVDDVRGRLGRGEAPAVAAAAARAALIARDPKSASWVDRLMVFE